MSNASSTSDLFQNDTTATGRTLDPADADRDAVVDAGSSSGPGTQADPASSTSAATGAVRSSGSPAAVPVESSGSGPAIDAVVPATQHSIPGAQDTSSAASDAKPPVDDYAIGHVFDQTNGVIEGIDGDSDGSAESDVLADGERSSANSTVAGAEVGGNREVDDTRSTGD